MPSSRVRRATLLALTPEAKAALGGGTVELKTFPFRVGRESRGRPRPATRTVADRRKSESRPTNDLYLPETAEPFDVSREQFQITHNGTHYVLVERQSTGGTLVEGTVVGGRHGRGAVQLNDGDIIIVGTSRSPYVFKFRLR